MAGNEASNRIELRVGEAPKPDVGPGRARIDGAARRLLGVEEGDVLEIEGKRRTLAVVQNLGPEDEGKGMIQIHSLGLENARVTPGEKVVIRRASVNPANEVEFAAVISEGHKVSFGQGIENFVKRGLLKRPLVNGDLVIVPGIALMGGALPFMVLHTKPEGNVRITEETTVRLRKQPFPKLESLSQEERFQAFVDRCAKVLSFLLAELEGELSTLSGKPGERAKILTGAIRGLLEDLQKNRNP